jgi:hypothetical protein
VPGNERDHENDYLLSVLKPPQWDDHGSASVTRRIEEMCRWPFNNDFATSSAL